MKKIITIVRNKVTASKTLDEAMEVYNRGKGFNRLIMIKEEGQTKHKIVLEDISDKI